MKLKAHLLWIVLAIGCQKKTPNVVFILVDDLGWMDLTCYGSTFYETPNLDQLASEGMLFTDAYSASPVCSPTRAALLTGKHPARLNITDWIPGMSLERVKDPQVSPPEDVHNLSLKEMTLAEKFKMHGYRTFFAGKWHLGESEDFWPTSQGFELNVGGNAWGSPGRFASENGYYAPYGNPQLSDGPNGEYLTDRLTDESIKFIDAQGKDPFFVYLAYYTVHTPIVGCNQYDAYFEGKKKALIDGGAVREREEHSGLTRINQSHAKYAAMVKSLDANVGRLMDFLKAAELENNTILVFTSDNGGLSTLKKSGPTSVEPLRAGKGWCYEGGVRIPLIIKYPPRIVQGSRSSVPTTSMDLYPTLLDLCKLTKDEQQHCDGKSIFPIKENEETPDRDLVWHYPHYHGSTWRPGSAIRVGNWKLIHFYEENKQELYDLSTDVGEQKNLCLVQPDKCQDLKEKLFSRLKSLNAKYPTPRK